MNKRISKIWRTVIVLSILLSFFISIKLILRINDIPKYYEMKQQNIVLNTKNNITEILGSKEYDEFENIFNDFIGEIKITDLTTKKIIYETIKNLEVNEDAIMHKEIYHSVVDESEYEIEILKYNVLTQDDFDDVVLEIVKIVILILILIIVLLAILLFKFLHPLRELKKNIANLLNFKLDEVQSDAVLSEYGTLSKDIADFSHELDVFIKQAGYKYTDLESKLQYNNEKLLYQNRLIASLTHDLKVPLVAIRYLIKEDKIDRLSIDKRVNDTIDEINDISKIVYEKDKITLEKENFDLIELLMDIYESYKPILKEKKMAIHFEVDSKIIIYDYRIQYKQLIHNAISNMVNYAKDNTGGEIVCYMEKGTLVLSFYNDSKPISKQHLDNVFKLFYRISDNKGGLGTGMFTIKHIASNLDGNIYFDNTKNGVILTFTKNFK